MGELTPSLDRQVTAASREIIRQGKVPIANAPSNDIVWGIVDSIQTGPPKTLTLYIQGDTTNAVAGVEFLGSYTPTVGDQVMCSKYGRDLVVLGSSSPGSSSSGTVVVGASYAVSGFLGVPAGPAFYLPGIRIPVPVGQTVTLLGVIYEVRNGSCTFDIQQNGTSIAAFTGLNATTTVTETDAPTALGNLDRLAPLIDTVTGAPDGLGLTFKLQITG
jgi:hypothetical protein